MNPFAALFQTLTTCFSAIDEAAQVVQTTMHAGNVLSQVAVTNANRILKESEVLNQQRLNQLDQKVNAKFAKESKQWSNLDSDDL